jgi:hypothetical protein
MTSLGVMTALPAAALFLLLSSPNATATADDAALLRAMRDDYVALTGERGRARQVLGALNRDRYDLKLGALRQAAGQEDVRARLVNAWFERFQAVGGPQPVDPRSACRLQSRVLEEALAGPPGSAAAGRLDAARAEARQCLTRLHAAVEAARSTARRLDAVLAEARELLSTEQPTVEARR